MPVPGFPSASEWEQFSYARKCSELVKAVEQMWGSLVITGRQLKAEIIQARAKAETRSAELETRIALLEARMGKAQDP
jgi:hypothetical protein